MQFDGSAVEKARLERGWSREALAREADVSTSSVFKIENGLTEPGSGIAARLAQALGIPLESLFTEDGAAA